MTDTDLLKPTYSRNMRLIGHSDQAGRSDGQQIMVRNGYAYIGHVCSKGFSVVDVRDPTRPKTVNYVQNPPNTWSLHLQVHDDLLLLVHGRDMFSQPEMADERNYYKPKSGTHGHEEAPHARNWSAGMAVFDISKPAEPRQIGFMPVDGTGLHRIWYVGGRWAYASAMLEGFLRLHSRHHRYAGPGQAADRRPLLAAGNEHRGRRNGRTGRWSAGATGCTMRSLPTISPIARGATAAW